MLRQFLTSSAMVLVYRITGAGLVFMMHVLLSRYMGVLAYGLYAVLWAAVNVFSVVTKMGLDGLLLREVPRAASPSQAQGLHRSALRWSFLVWSAICGTALVVMLPLEKSGHWADWRLWGSGAALLLFYSLMQVSQAVQRGMHHAPAAEFSFSIIRPVMILIGLLIVARTVQPVPAHWALTLTGAGCLGALLYSYLFLQRKAGSGIVAGAEPRTAIEAKHALPFIFLSSANLLQANVDILMLGQMSGAESAGIYSAASRITTGLAMVLAAANMVTAPKISALYHAGDQSRVQRLVGIQALVVTLVGIAVLLGLLVLGEWILGVFGDEFVAGYAAMTILLIGQMVNAVCGPVGYLATMSNHARTAAKLMWVALVVNVILNALLIPLWGIEGAAVATGASMVVWNLGLVAFTIRRLDVNPTIMAFVTRPGFYSKVK